MLAPDSFCIPSSTTIFIYPQQKPASSKNWYNRGTYRLERRHLDDPLKPYLAPIRNVPSFHLPVDEIQIFNPSYPYTTSPVSAAPTPCWLKREPVPETLLPQRGLRGVQKRARVGRSVSERPGVRGGSAMSLKLVLNDVQREAESVSRQLGKKRNSSARASSRPPLTLIAKKPASISAIQDNRGTPEMVSSEHSEVLFSPIAPTTNHHPNAIQVHMGRREGDQNVTILHQERCQRGAIEAGWPEVVIKQEDVDEF